MKSFAIALTIVVAAISVAQGTKADYERSEQVPNLYRTKVFKLSVNPVWLPDGNHFWYRNDLGSGKREFFLVDAKAGKRAPAFDHKRLATHLVKVANKSIDPERLPIQPLAFENGKMRFKFDGKAWECNLTNYEIEPATNTGGADANLKPFLRPRRSRDGGEECNVIFENQTKGDIHLIWVSSDGNEVEYGVVQPGKTRDMHTYTGHIWKVTDDDKKVLAFYEAANGTQAAVVDGKPISTTRPEPRNVPGLSPDGKWQAFVKENNLFVRDAKKSEGAVQFSTEGKDKDAYSLYEIYWSPDSKKLVAMRVEAGDDRKVYFVESSPKDQLQPKLHTMDYAKPGDKLPFPRPQLFDLATHKQTSISTELFPNPYFLSETRWTPDSKSFTLHYNQRGHQIYRILSVDGDMGVVKTLIEEAPKTFVDYSQKTFCEYLDATNEIIWASERDGWNHLYLIDSRSGKIKNQITKGNWVMRQVERVDPVKRQIWFQVLGYYPNQDPYYTHYARVNFDGTGLTLLTEGDGTHKVVYSPDGRFLVDNYSRVDMPPTTELRSSDNGKLICELEKADITEATKAGRPTTEHFVAMGRDGKTPIYGLIQRPSNFDPTKKYPVIEQIYAGPHGFSTPKAFAPFQWAQQTAELGFIVVQIDGMGTNWRSKAFHDVCWKNIGDAGFPDRILWMKTAAQKYPYMDIERVGVIGGSAGGQNAARAVFAFGDFYKVAIADCGCHDNRMDKIWWNEAWMGWPIGKEYEEQSNVTQAHNLTGKLFLIVGEMDTNVDPASTMQVVNALIKANKDFDLLVYPGGGHCPGGSPYGKRREEDFFVRNLLGVEPRSK